MARNIFVTLNYDNSGTDSFTIPAGGACSVDIDLIDIHNSQFFIEGEYQATDTPTGLTINIHYGTGTGDPSATGPSLPCVLGGSTYPTVYMSDNFDTLSVATYTAGLGSPQTKITFFSANTLVERVPRWVRLVITNTDATNDCVVRIMADV
jgi:hypothetical protein